MKARFPDAFPLIFFRGYEGVTVMALIVKQQDEIEVFVNDYGQIEISAHYNAGSGTSSVSFNKEYAELICLAIKKSVQDLYDMDGGQ